MKIQSKFEKFIQCPLKFMSSEVKCWLSPVFSWFWWQHQLLHKWAVVQEGSIATEVIFIFIFIFTSSSAWQRDKNQWHPIHREKYCLPFLNYCCGFRCTLLSQTSSGKTGKAIVFLPIKAWNRRKIFNSLAGVGFPPGVPQPRHQHQPHTDPPPLLHLEGGACPTTKRGLQRLLHLKRCRSKYLFWNISQTLCWQGAYKSTGASEGNKIWDRLQKMGFSTWPRVRKQFISSWLEKSEKCFLLEIFQLDMDV